MRGSFERGPLIGTAALAIAALVFAIALGRSVTDPGGTLQASSPSPAAGEDTGPVEAGPAGPSSDAASALAHPSPPAPQPSSSAVDRPHPWPDAPSARTPENGVPAAAARQVGAQAAGAQAAGSTRTSAGAGSPLPVEVLRLAVNRAPFAPNRRPSAPYRMPGDPVDRPQREAEPPPPPPAFHVLGTVRDGNGGVAVMRLEDGEPRVMSRGEELSGYTLASVGEGRVTMVGPEHSLELAVADARATSVSRDDDDDGRRSRRERQRAERMEEQALEFRARAMQAARALQAETGGQVRVQINGDELVIIGPEGQRRTMELPSSMEGRERILAPVNGMRIMHRPGAVFERSGGILERSGGGPPEQ